MVDAVDFEKIEGFPDIGGWAFFAGMGKEMQALGARRFKDARKLDGGCPTSLESRPTPKIWAR